MHINLKGTNVNLDLSDEEALELCIQLNERVMKRLSLTEGEKKLFSSTYSIGCSSSENDGICYPSCFSVHIQGN